MSTPPLACYSLLEEDGHRLGNRVLVNILHCDTWHLRKTRQKPLENSAETRCSHIAELHTHTHGCTHTEAGTQSHGHTDRQQKLAIPR